MNCIKLTWYKYNNFFELWRSHRDATQMIYVIGETNHCYIGCIGINEGDGGLGQRYQWQYIHRSRAIFGTDESNGQISFSALFEAPKNITGGIIGDTEAFVQLSFINMYGIENALFQPRNSNSDYTFEHHGSKPNFLA